MDGDKRINTPGTVGSPNGEFKLDTLNEFDTGKLNTLLKEYNRI